ncbi:MAG: hypothetical protein GX262_02795 [Clostridia bacterium]|jgi:hypothetical protein|nr:hypothetical protein [Clostridia bacterium]
MISSVLMLAVVPVLIIAVIFVIAVAVRGSAGQGGENVIKTVYVYLVLFATLMMIIGGSVSAFMAVADIVAPTPYYQTFEDFRRYSSKDMEFGTQQGEIGEPEQVSEQELRERYDAMVQAEKDRQINRAKNSLIKSMGWIVIPLPIFVYFQRLRKEAD